MALNADLDSIRIRKKFFFRVAKDAGEYEKRVTPNAELLQKLRKRGADLFSFPERRWCSEVYEPQDSWAKSVENIALLNLNSYDEWLKRIGKKTRNMIRKSIRCGIRTAVVEPDERLAEGVWKIFSETPIRQGRVFSDYGISLNRVMEELHSRKNFVHIGAYLRDELAGFIQLVEGENIERILRILSLQRHWDKAVNNALIAKAVEVSASKGVKWMMYDKMGDFRHGPSCLSLEKFKRSNGFRRFQLTRYHIPITRKGALAVRLGLHKEMKETLPPPAKYRIAAVYYWLSRSKIRVKAH